METNNTNNNIDTILWETADIQGEEASEFFAKNWRTHHWHEPALRRFCNDDADYTTLEESFTMPDMEEAVKIRKIKTASDEEVYELTFPNSVGETFVWSVEGLNPQHSEFAFIDGLWTEQRWFSDRQGCNQAKDPGLPENPLHETDKLYIKFVKVNDKADSDDDVLYDAEVFLGPWTGSKGNIDTHKNHSLEELVQAGVSHVNLATDFAYSY